jgi:predicted nucleic acid-binding Zn ribbon protein
MMAATPPGRGGTGRPRRRAGSGRPETQLSRDRRASAADRDEWLYQRKRRQQARQRAKAERAAYDPAPPDDEDWTIGADDSDGLVRLTPPTGLDESLRELIRRRGWEERLRGASAWARWDHIVGEDLAARCEPVKLVRGVLTIRAESQIWATQLRYMIPQLTANVEASLGAGTVREVRIVVGALEGRDRPDGETGP